MSELVSSKLFDLEKTYEYILSIQVNLNGFSFSVLSASEDKILVFKLNQHKISSTALIARRFNDWLDSEELLKKPFKKIRVIVFSNKFTLFPDDYYRNTLNKNISSLLFDDINELEIAENVIGELKTRLVFALPTGINDVIVKQIGECEIVHPMKIVLGNLPEANRENGLILFFDTKDFYIALFNKAKILLVNNFEMSHVNDVVYYVLTILKQMDISTSETNLFIVDSVNKIPGIKNSFNSYFNEIDELVLISFQSGADIV